MYERSEGAERSRRTGILLVAANSVDTDPLKWRAPVMCADVEGECATAPPGQILDL